jgi:hypothetical protein
MVATLNATNRNLHNYKLQKSKKPAMSEKFINKASAIWNGTEYYEEETFGEKIAHGLHNAIEATKFLVYGISAITAESLEAKNRKNKLTEILKCEKQEISIDINELIRNKEQTIYYGDTFTYSAATDKKWLKNIKMIWGDAELQALDNMECFANLESVWGDVYFSRCTDLTGLGLRIVYGDIHGEKLVNSNGLENLLHVGGTIYYQDKEFKKLEEFYLYINSSNKQIIK